MRKLDPDQIDALLPQTQCGLCGYGGCMPYAEAIAYEHAPIDLCPPGGVETLIKLGNLAEEDPTPFISKMQLKAKPPFIAKIREDECIGCTKCIAACPLDAILGSAKKMHTIISDECSGCELCIAPCPVDCIDLIPSDDTQNKQAQYRKRFLKRNERLLKINLEKEQLNKDSELQKKRYIEQALARVKHKQGKL